MSATPEPMFGFTRVFVNRSFSLGNLPWTMRLLLIFLAPLILIFILGLVFLGLVIFGVVFLIQVVVSLLTGTVSTRVTVNRQTHFSHPQTGLPWDESRVETLARPGQVIDIFPEPKKEGL